MVQRRTTFDIKICTINFKILRFAFVSFVSMWCKLSLSSCSLKIILKINSVWPLQIIKRLHDEMTFFFNFHLFTSFYLCLIYKLLWGFRNLHFLCDLIYALLTLTAIRMTRQSKSLSPSLANDFFANNFIYFSVPALQQLPLQTMLTYKDQYLLA